MTARRAKATDDAEPTPAPATHRVLWRRTDVAGTEWCELRVGEAPSLRGVVTLAWEGRPIAISYAIALDDAGRTRRVVMTADGIAAPISVTLDADGKGRWSGADGVVVDAPDALDVDLGFSPSTNTLPIRRLGLAIGESREIGVAWVLFPSFDVEYGRQTYTRLAERRWLYRSPGYEAELTVDDVGLVERYADWESVAGSRNPG